MTKKLRSDSITAKVQAAKSAIGKTKPPEGLARLLKKEWTAWRQYTDARHDWREADLRTLHRLVKNESKLAKLEQENVALDIGNYRSAPPGFRIWGGATVETGDLEALTPWLDWVFADFKQTMQEK